MKIDALSNQLRWVILLLAAAVILPTICLLWFMNQAVKNERLATRSKLISIYRNEIDRVFSPFKKWVIDESKKAQVVLSQNTSYYDIFHALSASESDFDSQGLIIYDRTTNSVMYPEVWNDFDFLDNMPDFQEGERLEFVEQSLENALKTYEHISKNTSNSILYKRCKLAEARILQKQGKLEQAITCYEIVQAAPLDNKAHWYLYTAANLKILDLLNIQGISDNTQANRLNQRIANVLYVIENIEYVQPSQRIFAYDQIIALSEKYATFLTKNNKKSISKLGKRIDLERKTLRFLSKYPSFPINPLQSRQPITQIEKIDDTDLYSVNLCLGYPLAGVDVIHVINLKQIVQELSKELNFSDNIRFRITDEDQHIIGGSAEDLSPFLAIQSTPFTGWNVLLCETGAGTNTFEQAARRQMSIYIWTGLLAVILMLSAGSISIRTVNHQIKMNRLKNDFIATVTHELKTPLSSMRLLVDTLLEGNYRDEQTVPEYLGLIATENKRLSHLIDSFLTFSRMERNKQVFDFQAVSPKAIAEAGAEAAKAKLNHGGCEFTLDIQETLPNVRADKDAMVTVLVNLLENACKYSGDDKHIHLSVYSHNGEVCFAVKDNGIGISRRDQKRIFNRFYQADSRLSRSVEGCGLGLSIVKFIIDAHKGTIDVESQPGQGSTFTVKLPKISCRA